MGAETVGRKLGIGLRLAARAARQRAGLDAATANPSASAPLRHSAPAIPMAASQLRADAGTRAKGLAQGTKRLGQAVVGPIAHTSGVLWLEITGLFFALFAAFFGQNVYRFRHAWQAGPDHRNFLVYSAFTLIFAWFTFWNFFKARQKEKRNRARQTSFAKR